MLFRSPRQIHKRFEKAQDFANGGLLAEVAVAADALQPPFYAGGWEGRSGSEETLHLGNIDIARDWGLAQEYVEAMWLMLQAGTADDYIIATGHTCTLREFVSKVFRTLGLNWQEHVQTDASLIRPSEITISCGCPNKAATILGWRARSAASEVVRLLVEAEQTRLAAAPSACL